MRRRRQQKLAIRQVDV
uniref:Uncharacterized protein n=1 Tax=Anguilla anguilla TaxID=7936 RepID=A0A0E9PFK7_ANGAN